MLGNQWLRRTEEITVSVRRQYRRLNYRGTEYTEGPPGPQDVGSMSKEKKI